MPVRLREEQFWLLTGGVLLMAFVGLSFALYFTRSFMIPFVFSIFLTSMVSPIENLLVVRYNFPRWVGFLGSFLAIIFLLLLLFFVVRFALFSITSTMGELGGMTDRFIERMDGLVKYTGIPLEKMADFSSDSIAPGVPLDTQSTEHLDGEGAAMMAKLKPDKKPDYDYLRVLLEPWKKEVPNFVNMIVMTFKDFITCGTLVLLFCLFILMGRNPRERVKNEIYNEVERSIQKYLNIKFFVSFLTGFLVYITFLCLGMKMAFLFGILAFVLNFIPSIGSIIATILPLPIAMVMPDFPSYKVFLVFLLPCIIQNVLGNIIEPRLQGRGLKLHPVTILLALGFWGVVWGPVGMLLAAPMTAAMRISMLEFKMTKWMAQIMGGKLPKFERTMEVDSDD